MKVLPAVFALLLAGCGGTSTIVWKNTEVSEAQSRKDLESCVRAAGYYVREIEGHLEVGAIFEPEEKAARLSACMEAKGYKRR